MPSKGDVVSLGSLKPLKLLLCEDNLINQKLMAKILISWNCSVEVANNGEEGVEMASKNDFDAILMDVQMPVMDGLTATIKLRQMGIDTPIIAVTANAMKGDREICISSGMNDYVTKPIVRENLMAALNKVCQMK